MSRVTVTMALTSLDGLHLECVFVCVCVRQARKVLHTMEAALCLMSSSLKTTPTCPP